MQILKVLGVAALSAFTGAALAQQPAAAVPAAPAATVPMAAGWLNKEYADPAGIPLKTVESFLNDTCQPSGLDGIQVLTLQKGHNETMNFHLYCRQDHTASARYSVTQLPIRNHQLDAAVNPVAGKPNIRLAAFYFGKDGDPDYFVVIEKLR
jgi:hypothetical protein